MKKARQVNTAGCGRAESFHIKVQGENEAGWQVPLRPALVAVNRRIPGSLVTNILCAHSPEQKVELRLTRYVCAQPEQLGFYLAQA